MKEPPNPDPEEPADLLGRRLEREQRSAQFKREDELSHSLAPFRVGSVRYLNAVPLTRGLEDEVKFTTAPETTTTQLASRSRPTRCRPTPDCRNAASNNWREVSGGRIST